MSLKYTLDSDQSGYFSDENGDVALSFVALANSDQQTNMEATARLFASAPDMLEALLAIQESLINGTHDEFNVAVALCFVAVSKAIGEQA